MYTGVCPYCTRFSIGKTMEILYNVLMCLNGGVVFGNKTRRLLMNSPEFVDDD
jgi:hypothetical protein